MLYAQCDKCSAWLKVERQIKKDVKTMSMVNCLLCDMVSWREKTITEEQFIEMHKQPKPPPLRLIEVGGDQDEFEKPDEIAFLKSVFFGE